MMDKTEPQDFKGHRVSKARKEILGPQERLDQEDYKENKVIKEKLGPQEWLDQ